MNAAGVVLAIAGIWVVSQVFGGNALERLNIIKPTSSAGGNASISDSIGGAAKDSIPGGKNNPPYIDFGKLFPNSTQGYARAL